MSNKFIIEKDLPIPQIRREGGRPPKYPFAKMKVGDSFFEKGKASKNFTAHALYARRHGAKFSVRTVEGGVRVWKISNE